MTDITDEYVAERAKYYRQLHAAAAQLQESKREELRTTGKVVLSRDELFTLTAPNQVFFELAYGLDEACAALKFYGNPNSWKEVPAEFQVAKDAGLKARVALARINPV